MKTFNQIRQSNKQVEEALSPSYKNKYIGKDKASLRKTRNSFLTQIDDLIKFKKKTTKSPEVVKLQDLLKQVDFAIKGVKESVEVDEAKAPKMKGVSIKGSEVTGLRAKDGKLYSAKPLISSGKLSYRVEDEFGAFDTIDLKTFAKRFG